MGSDSEGVHEGGDYIWWDASFVTAAAWVQSACVSREMSQIKPRRYAMVSR